MEDVKELTINNVSAGAICVSILVLMEDVKEHCHNLLYYFYLALCFNPCFNGRCKRTRVLFASPNHSPSVSILVLMEDVKEQLRHRSNTLNLFLVSILVLMEDVKERY